MKKRIISFLLSLCMVWSLLPGAAWAEETNSVTNSAPSTIEGQQPSENQKPEDENFSTGDETKVSNGSGNGSGSAGDTQQSQNIEGEQSGAGSQSEANSQPNGDSQPNAGSQTNGASQSDGDQQSKEGEKAVADSNGTTVEVDDGKAVIIKDNAQTEYGTLDDAMKAAASVDTIYLGKGTYCGNATSPTTAGKGAGKSLTFVGAGTDKTTWQINAPATAYGSDGWCDYSFKNSDSIIFQNMTVVSSVYPDKTTKANDTQGLTYINHITLKNCVFNGRADYWGYETTTFENVIFNAPGTEASGISGTNKTNYSLWTYTGKTYTFKNCEFNSTGKTINVYRQGDPGYDVTVDFENCTVKNIAHKKQAMKINDSTMGQHKYTINISGDNKVEGIEPNKFTCSRLFGFDPDDNDQDNSSENSGRTVVNIEGTKVWQNGKRVGSHNQDFENGSYNNGVATDNANKYTDGYKDDKFTTSYGDWAFKQETGKFTRTVTKTCDYCGYKETTDETKELELDVSRSKTATALDSNYQSTVTLSLPSAEENLATDVVLALDVSKCTKKTLAAVQELLNDLYTVQEESGANIKIGIAMFKGSAVPFQKLETLTESKNKELQTFINGFLNQTTYDDAEHAVRAYLERNFSESEYLNTGTNMPAGLLLAKKMLDEDTDVEANRKYMILVSDGSTYLFTHGNDYSTAWSRQSAYNNGSYRGGLYESNMRHSDFLMSLNATNEEWTAWLDKVAEFSATFTDEYDYQWKGTETPCPKQIPYDNNNGFKFLVNGDTSIYQSATFYKEMQKTEYNCYYCYAYDTEDYYGRNVLKSLNDNDHLIDGSEHKNVFSDIEKDIIFAVGAGSVVEDKMGADFDFVPGSLKLTVNKEPLDSKVDGNTTYFGAKDTKKEIGSDNYRFKVKYDSTDDKFIWTINENVSNFAPVQLSYKVTLVKPNTAAGTYGQTDLNGDGKVDGTNTDVDPNTALYTNESATLTPTDSEGHQGKPLTFPKPSVSYTVKSSSSGSSSSKKSSSATQTSVVTAIGTNPKTGDDCNVTLWIGLCVASALALGGVSFYRRKKQ